MPYFDVRKGWQWTGVPYFLYWGRRKKCYTTVENGIDNDEQDEANLDDNKNKIVSVQSPSDSSYHSDKEDTADYHGNKEDDILSTHEEEAPLVKKKKDEPSTEEKVTAILKEIQSAAPDSTSDTDKTPYTLKHGSYDRQKRKHTDDPKIAELLNRRDTAVIYPEPVSDGEDHQNGEGAACDHEEEIILTCMHCPKTFNKANDLRDHMRERHSDKPLKFMCPKCDETFHQKSQLDKHLTLHSPTSQICPICNKTFANVYRLQRHEISHKESEDLRKFKCPECGKAFKFKHHLKEHVRIHSGEKPFVCNNCGKRFSHSGSFSSHTTSKKCWGLSAQKNRVGQDGIQNLTQNISQSGGQSMSGFGQKLPVTFPSGKAPQFQRTPLQSVPVTMAHQQHFIPNPYTQQKGIPPFYYSSQMFASPDGFLHPVYTMPQSLQHMPHALAMSSLHQGMKPEQTDGKERSPSVSSVSSSARSTRSISPHSQSTRSFSPHSYSGRSISPQSSSAFSLSSPAGHGLHSSTPVRSSKETTPILERKLSNSIHQDSEQISPDVNSNTKLLVTKEEPKSTSEEAEEVNVEPNTSEAEEIGSSVKEEVIVEEKTKEKPEIENENVSTTGITCHFCDEVFDSPVTQHQHERYMCKLNKDLASHRLQTESCQSPHSTVSDTSHIESTSNGSIGNHTDEEEVEELYKDNDVTFDEKKMRIRSLFTEDQQMYLKQQYLSNPRPRKYELIRMGNKIGFPKRVVQVWFQNMRARERKQGREAAFGHGAVKAENTDRELSKSPTYIPNVPKLSTVMNLTNQKNPTHIFGPQQPVKTSTGEAPLDLTVRVRKSPPLAHGGNLSRMSTPDRSSNDDQALNLSVKKDDSVEREKSEEKTVSQAEETDQSNRTVQKSLEDSAIFKYMQQEGMIASKFPELVPITLAQAFHAQRSKAMAMSMPVFRPGTSSADSKGNSSLLFDPSNGMENSKCDGISSPRLIIDEARSEVSALAKDSMTYSVSPSNSHGLKISHPLHEDTHNLATLAEAAQHAANILSGKPKRLRKKTWRQMESEEVQLDFEDSVSTDEDQPLKKKRKSWKNHRVDREEGMYACDQCNKVFSKQSSLARHKYEHSGARPFACDMCTKSFKHKHHLTEHKRLHSGEKPFQCKKCGKRFSHSGSFSQHMNHRYNYCSPHKLSDGDGDELSSQDSP